MTTQSTNEGGDKVNHPDPKGTRFYSQSRKQEMMLCTDEEFHSGHLKGWLLYRHPDGQWVTLRVATPKDLEELNNAPAFLEPTATKPDAKGDLHELIGLLFQCREFIVNCDVKREIDRQRQEKAGVRLLQFIGDMNYDTTQLREAIEFMEPRINECGWSKAMKDRFRLLIEAARKLV